MTSTPWIPSRATGRHSLAARRLYRLLALLACAFAAPAYAQLDESCTVSILNRSAQVRPDGSWQIDNVPAGFGPVRARATCAAGGVTRSGESAYFTLQAGSITGFDAEILLGQAEPIPESLAIISPVPQLGPDQTAVQLRVIARYSDGSSREVTPRSAGTSYTSSNPAVATVGPDGLVTAVGSGTALISAGKDGALGLIRLSVRLSDDTDGDGIGDDLELANGLDPQDPIDGLLDLDGDGLSNRQELIEFGTAIRQADSDGDGLADGEEVTAGADGFRTDPLRDDTDGDGLRDGLEITTGTDRPGELQSCPCPALPRDHPPGVHAHRRRPPRRGLAAPHRHRAPARRQPDRPDGDGTRHRLWLERPADLQLRR